MPAAGVSSNNLVLPHEDLPRQGDEAERRRREYTRPHTRGGTRAIAKHEHRAYLCFLHFFLSTHPLREQPKMFPREQRGQQGLIVLYARVINIAPSHTGATTTATRRGCVFLLHSHHRHHQSKHTAPPAARRVLTRIAPGTSPPHPPLPISNPTQQQHTHNTHLNICRQSTPLTPF